MGSGAGSFLGPAPQGFPSMSSRDPETDGLGSPGLPPPPAPYVKYPSVNTTAYPVDRIASGHHAPPMPLGNLPTAHHMSLMRDDGQGMVVPFVPTQGGSKNASPLGQGQAAAPPQPPSAPAPPQPSPAPPQPPAANSAAPSQVRKLLRQLVPRTRAVPCIKGLFSGMVLACRSPSP